MDEVENELSEIRRRVARGHVDSGVLLALLAAAGRANGPQAAQAAETLREHAETLEPTWNHLCAWVRDWPSPPDVPEHLRSWLLEFESLGLAHEALPALPDVAPSAKALREALLDAFGRFRGQVEARRDHARFAGIAEQHNRELGKSVAPWSWLRAGEVLTLIGESEDGPTVAAELWLSGRLHSADANLLETEVTSNDTFRNAYTGLLRSRLANLEATLWSPAWSLDVARTDADLKFVPPALEVPLPHLNQVIQVWGHGSGTYWRGPLDAPGFVAHGVQQHRYSIPQVGEFTTELSYYAPSNVHDVWHGLTSLDRVADERFVEEGSANERLTARGEEVVDAFITSFESGVLHDALREGHEAFERGADTSEDLEDLVRYAVEARLTLSLALKSLSALGRPVEALSLRLATADEELQACSSAVLLVDRREYRDLVEGVPLDRNAWWAARRILDERVPEGIVDGMLTRELGAAKAAKVIPFRAANRLRLFTSDSHLALAAADAVMVPKDVCPWLANKQAAGPEIGQVPLLLVDESAGTGVLAQLSISRAEPAPDGTVWRNADVLGDVARAAIHDAYWAAGTQFAAGLPPISLTEHRFDLVFSPGIQVDIVDGSSVGVAAALAFASLWTGTPIPRDLAVTGAVSPTGDVLPVGYVYEKATRLRDTTPERLRLVVASRNADDASGVAVEVLPVGGIADVLAAAGIRPQHAKQSSPSVSSCELRLNQLITAVQTGNPSGRHAHAWREIGDDLAWLVKALSQAPTRINLIEARCWTALAYLHAAVRSSAKWILTGVDPRAVPRIDTRTLLDVITAEDAIDHRAVTSDVLSSLVQDIEELGNSDGSSPMLGYALGTLGRAHMHGGNAEAAIPFLRRALKHHQEFQPWEAARSRIYLSMALRLARDSSAALEHLYAANEELGSSTRQYSPQYELSCRMYHQYERARALLALERYPEAERAASEAEEGARWTNWPLLGILRTRAWALRMMGRDAEADHDVERMKGIDIERWIKEPLVDEAQGYPFEGGEVY